MNSSMVNYCLLSPSRKGFRGNVHNFDEYLSSEALILPSMVRMSGYLGIEHCILESWLYLQNVPTKADFFVVALRTSPELRIFFNHHIEESFSFIFSLDSAAYREWLECSFIQKLRRSNLISAEKAAILTGMAK
ncbi:hypothetical protein [Alteromonas stellipolaris]|uniref:hypothetical protein n=1 Tax=Alteromonas stellipolaris TaxID=233316 RepID=UPI002732ED4F|nr:hypothetical protein [Alteromonas stellipolaris]MDP2595141.1 hypothetical protein [Alteromonas stellipolaris]